MGRDLPVWPFAVFGLAFPVLWVLGFGFLYPALVGLCMLGVLLSQRWVLLPRGWFIWAAYLVFMIVSAVQVDTMGRMVGLGFRVMLILAGTVVMLYIFSASPGSVTVRHVYAALAGYWAFLIIGGWLGVLFPDVVLTTPAASVLPGALTENELVGDMVRPAFAEIQQPWGAQEAFSRPAAPFPGSNGWGTNFALLAPMMLRYITMLRGAPRIGLIALSLAGLVPAAATLNRGMMLGLVVGLVYGLIHAAFQGRWGQVRALAVVGLAGGVVAVAGGVVGAIVQRTEVSDSTQGRADIYTEAFDRTLDSPLLGYGAPRNSYLLDISVGTQGQAWNVLFSHGFIALALHVAFLLWLVWAGRRARPPADAAHVTVVVGAVLFWIYGFGGAQFLVLMAAAGLSLRDSEIRRWALQWQRREPLRGRVSAPVSVRPPRREAVPPAPAPVGTVSASPVAPAVGGGTS